MSSLTTVPLIVLILSTLYAALLEWAERRFPAIHPNWIWVEVVGGTAIMLGPGLIAVLVVQVPDLVTATDMAQVIIRSVLAAGAPIIVWQGMLALMGREQARQGLGRHDRLA